MKNEAITIHSNGFIIRFHNTRVTAVEREDGSGMMITCEKAGYSKKDLRPSARCIRTPKGIQISKIAFTRRALELISMAMVRYTRERLNPQYEK